MVADVDRWLPWAIGSVGLVLSTLAGWLVWTLVSAHHLAERRARQMTAELRASEAELARSNLELERFAYAASHDLQEPLRTIGNFVGLLDRRYGDQLDDDARQYIGLVVDGADRMAGLINDLLGYSRAGQVQRVEEVDLEETWQLATAALAAAIADADADVSAGPLPMVRGDGSRLVQVLQNLLSNALKYRTDGRVEVRCHARRVGDCWEVTVQDNGIGIDPAQFDEIFVMLRRLHTREEYPGTGMGLAIAKKIMEEGGGSIRVESEPGHGARFVLSLPATDVVDLRQVGPAGADQQEAVT